MHERGATHAGTACRFRDQWPRPVLRVALPTSCIKATPVLEHSEHRPCLIGSMFSLKTLKMLEWGMEMVRFTSSKRWKMILEDAVAIWPQGSRDGGSQRGAGGANGSGGIFLFFSGTCIFEDVELIF